MAIITKNPLTQEIIAIAAIAASGQTKGEKAVPSQFGGRVFIWFGRRAATAAGAGVKIRVEFSSQASGDGFWINGPVFETDFAAATAQAATGTNSAGQALIQMAATAGFVAGGKVYVDNTTLGNSEWGRIKSVNPNVSITLEDNLLFAQNAGSATVYTLAEMYTAQLDLTPDSRVRVVVDGTAFTQGFAIRARLTTGDSIA